MHHLAGWHVELYIDARFLANTWEQVAALPAVSIDHMGLHRDGLPQLLRLVEHGAKVKATGFGRVDLDPAAAIRAIMAVDPTALMAGTDLPSTRARRPFENADLELIRRAVEPEQLNAVLRDNAAEFYLREPRSA